MRNMLAVDASLTSTGISMGCEASTLRLIPPKGTMGLRRLQWLKEELTELFLAQKIDLMIIEGYSFGSHGRSFSIGELGGVLKLLSWEMSIDILVVPPTVLKKYTTGLGNSNKEKMLKAVHKRWRFLTFYNDEADAYALYKFGEDYISRGWKRTKEGYLFAGKCEYIISE